mmetsp:Transcript_79833/g.171096  ORF Transcript_79833/g.171096 Transcript_79833/m.171096 type:complete len:108 (+) Transcript_79833:274-597(+)
MVASHAWACRRTSKEPSAAQSSTGAGGPDSLPISLVVGRLNKPLLRATRRLARSPERSVGELEERGVVGNIVRRLLSAQEEHEPRPPLRGTPAARERKSQAAPPPLS